MNQLRKQFGELLRGELFKNTEKWEGSSKQSLQIIEHANLDKDDEKLKEFTIVNLPEESVAFSLDPEHSSEITYLKNSEKKFGKIDLQYFSWVIRDEHKDAGKKCDIIIVTRSNNEFIVLIGELKSQNLQPSKFEPQLKNSHFAMKYILDLFNEYHAEEVLVPQFIQIVFTNSKRADQIVNKSVVNQSNSEVEPIFIKVSNREELDYNFILANPNLALNQTL